MIFDDMRMFQRGFKASSNGTHSIAWQTKHGWKTIEPKCLGRQ